MKKGKDYLVGKVNDPFNTFTLTKVGIPRVVKYLKKQKVIALDIETGRRYKKGLYPEDVYKPGLDPFVSRIMMVQIGTLDKRFIIDPRFNDLSFLKDILEDNSILKVGHNLKFEGKFFLHHCNIRLVNVWDTMLAEKILYNGYRHSYSLAALQFRYLNIKPVQNIDLFNTIEDDFKDFNYRVKKLISQSLLLGKYLTEDEAVEIVESELLKNQYVDKSIRLGFIELGNEPYTLQQIEYGSDDITTPLQIYERQKEGRLVDGELYKPELGFKLENKFTQVLAEAEVQGVPFSKIKWKKAYEEAKLLYQKRLNFLNDFVISKAHANNKFAKIHAQFVGTANLFTQTPTCAIKWTSSKEVIKYFKSLKMCPKEKSSTTGRMAFTVGAKTLLRKLPNNLKGNFFKGKDLDKIVTKSDLILQYLLLKRSEQLCTTFGEKWLNYVHPITYRVHTNFNQYMISSRLSSSNPNMQQIPGQKAYRDCFTVEEPYKLINADYSSQEIRVASEVHNVPKMIEFFVKGDPRFGSDYHSFSASNMQQAMRNDPNYIVEPKELPNGEKNPAFTSTHSKERNDSKALTFKLNYGGSPYTVAMDLGIEEEEAERYIENYFKGFPGLLDSFEVKRKEAFEKGWIEIDPYTKKRYFFPDHQKMLIAQEKAKALRPKNWSKMSPEEKQVMKTWLRVNTEWSALWKEFMILKGKLERRGLNIPIQGSSATMTKLAGILIYNYRWKHKLQDKIQVPLYVHDETLAKTEEKLAAKTAKIVESCMKQAGKIMFKQVPMDAQAVISNVWEH